MTNKKYNKFPKYTYIINIFIVLKFFYFQLLINSIKSECQKNEPILINNECKLEYC